MRRLLLLSSCALFLSLAPTRADDWPQWLGPQRDSVWRETGIVETFPDKGLKFKWRVAVAHGYAGPAVAGGKVYLTDYVVEKGEFQNGPGTRPELEGTERVRCFDATTGKELWKYTYNRPYHIAYPGGPRATPTVADGKVYALGAEGNLTCLDADDGKLLWKKDFKKDYGAETPVWGHAAHPLVAGDLVYCLVGGKGSVAVAFDKNTGREVWKALTADPQGYCPPTMITHDDRQQLLIWDPQFLNSLDPKTGKLYWKVPLAPAYQMSIAAPILSGDYLYTCGMGRVAALLKLDEEPKTIWTGKATLGVYSSTAPPVIDKGVIYGCDAHTGALIAAKLENGQRLWQTLAPTTHDARSSNHGTCYLVKHEDRFFIFSETGDLILAKLTPEKYQELSRYHVLEPTNECFSRPVVWSHPAFANKAMYARNDKELVCVDLAK